MAAPISDTSPDITMDEDYEWHCPTEAELKIIQARRERSDLISKIMGDYLLKGYTMLGSTCDVCQTILLRNKAGKNYCIACSELDSDTDKDNPVVNQDAALAQAKEAELSSKLFSKTNSQGTNPHRSRSPLNLSMDTMKVIGINSSIGKSELEPEVATRTADVSGFDHDEGQIHRPVSKVDSDIHIDVSKTMRVLYDKIHWATEELKTSASIEYALQLCQLIKYSADAVKSLKKN